MYTHIQVWFSSCWGTSTLTSFQRAIASILSNDDVKQVNTTIKAKSAVRAVSNIDARNSHGSTSKDFEDAKLPSEIREILTYWQKAKVSLLEARKKWLEIVGQDIIGAPGSHKKKEDRHALCTYALTGELPG